MTYTVEESSDPKPLGPPTLDQTRYLRVAAGLARDYADLSCQALSEGRVEDATYFAAWQRALAALSQGEDITQVNFPPMRH